LLPVATTHSEQNNKAAIALVHAVGSEQSDTAPILA